MAVAVNLPEIISYNPQKVSLKPGILRLWQKRGTGDTNPENNQEMKPGIGRESAT